MAATIDELLLLGCCPVVGVSGGLELVAAMEGFAVNLSGGVDRADSPLLDDAFAECNTDLEDIVWTVQLC
jgi:hypothetical protein